MDFEIFDIESNLMQFASYVLAVELVDNIENQPWFQHSSEKAQKQQLKKIKDSIRAITRSKMIPSSKGKSAVVPMMSEKEAKRIRKPRPVIRSKFKKGSDGFL